MPDLCRSSLLVAPGKALHLRVLAWHAEQQLLLPLAALCLQVGGWLGGCGCLHNCHFSAADSTSLDSKQLKNGMQAATTLWPPLALMRATSPNAIPRTASSNACRSDGTSTLQQRHQAPRQARQ